MLWSGGLLVPASEKPAHLRTHAAQSVMHRTRLNVYEADVSRVNESLATWLGSDVRNRRATGHCYEDANR